LARAFAVLSLLAVLNIGAAPLAHAVAPTGHSADQVVAELRATFGDIVQLCVNDDGSQPSTPLHHDGDCPLCCLHVGAALVPPDIVKLPARRAVISLVNFAARDFAPPPPARASPAQPRAPPSLS
jgi:hypothetical protein